MEEYKPLERNPSLDLINDIKDWIKNKFIPEEQAIHIISKIENKELTYDFAIVKLGNLLFERHEALTKLELDSSLSKETLAEIQEIRIKINQVILNKISPKIRGLNDKYSINLD